MMREVQLRWKLNYFWTKRHRQRRRQIQIRSWWWWQWSSWMESWTAAQPKDKDDYDDDEGWVESWTAAQPNFAPLCLPAGPVPLKLQQVDTFTLFLALCICISISIISICALYGLVFVFIFFAGSVPLYQQVGPSVWPNLVFKTTLSAGTRQSSMCLTPGIRPPMGILTFAHRQRYNNQVEYGSASLGIFSPHVSEGVPYT